jgi:hypothetical protein
MGAYFPYILAEFRLVTSLKALGKIFARFPLNNLSKQ